jgi:hypothetical protein
VYVLKKRASVIAIVTLGLLLPVAAAGFAETVVYNLTYKAVRQVLAGTGSTYEKSDDDAFRFNVGSFKCVFFNKGDNFQLYAGFTDADVSTSDVNRWNRIKRFAKAYIDDEGDACLEADFSLEGGTTLENMVQFTELYKSLVRDFTDFIGF